MVWKTEAYNIHFSLSCSPAAHIEPMKKAKPAIKSSTMWGGVIGVLGAALPFITVELARMPPSPATRWVGFVVAVLGGVLVVRGRAGDPAPVRGLFTTKGSR